MTGSKRAEGRKRVEARIAHLLIPELGATVARRVEPTLARGLALLDEAGTVVAVDDVAAAAGVGPGLAERQAVARLPALTLRPAARYPLAETQEAVLAQVARYTDRWQPVGLGAAYLDATRMAGDLLGWCQELGQALRELGLRPALGLTGSKFGAYVASWTADPQSACIVAAAAQADFLAGQPAALLPLDAAAQLQLRWLGVRTLGQYARLPAAGVAARWGEAGKTAQRWAVGRDERPVLLPDEQPEATRRIEFDGPVADRDILLAAIMRAVDALAAPLRAQLQAVGRLRLTVTRGDGRRLLPVERRFARPTVERGPLRLACEQLLGEVAWDGEGAADLVVTLAGITDAPAQQMTLFDEPSPRAALVATIDHLTERYGPDAFRMAALTEPEHPLPERRGSWRAFS